MNDYRHRNMQTVDRKKGRRQQACFSCCISMSKQRRLHFLHHIAREQTTIQTILNIVRCKELRGYDEHATINHYMLSSARGDDNEHILDVASWEKQRHNFLMLREAVVLSGSVRQQYVRYVAPLLQHTRTTFSKMEYLEIFLNGKDVSQVVSKLQGCFSRSI